MLLLDERTEEDFPIIVTSLAIERMLIAKDEDPDMKYIRVFVEGSGCAGFKNNLSGDDETDDEDFVKEFFFNDRSIKVIIDNISAVYLKGITLDYVMSDMQEGFKFVGGQVKNTCACGSSVGY